MPEGIILLYGISKNLGHKVEAITLKSIFGPLVDGNPPYRARRHTGISYPVMASKLGTANLS